MVMSHGVIVAMESTGDGNLFFFLANSCQSVAVLMTCRQMSLSLAYLQLCVPVNSRVLGLDVFINFVDGNVAVKCETFCCLEQCCLVTVSTACCFCVDPKPCSLGLTKIDLLFFRWGLVSVLVWTSSLVN